MDGANPIMECDTPIIDVIIVRTLTASPHAPLRVNEFLWELKFSLLIHTIPNSHGSSRSASHRGYVSSDADPGSRNGRRPDQQSSNLRPQATTSTYETHIYEGIRHDATGT